MASTSSGSRWARRRTTASTESGISSGGVDKIVIYDPNGLVNDLDPLKVTFQNGQTVIDLDHSLAGAGAVVISDAALGELDIDIVADDMPLLLCPPQPVPSAEGLSRIFRSCPCSCLRTP